MIIDSIIKNARSAIKEDQIKKCCEQFCNYVGFNNYLIFGSVFHTMIHPPKIILSNIGISGKPRASEYQPLVEDAIMQSTPIISANLAKNSLLRATSHIAKYKTRRRAAKNTISISFPVHFPCGRFALLHVKTEADNNDCSELIMNVMISGNLFAREIGTAILRVLEYSLGNETPYLSVREKECLLLASDGLNPKLISNQLGLSTHTVLFHLKKARKKLTCKNLQGAISKAIMSGDITANIDSKHK